MKFYSLSLKEILRRVCVCVGRLWPGRGPFKIMADIPSRASLVWNSKGACAAALRTAWDGPLRQWTMTLTHFLELAGSSALSFIYILLQSVSQSVPREKQGYHGVGWLLKEHFCHSWEVLPPILLLDRCGVIVYYRFDGCKTVLFLPVWVEQCDVNKSEESCRLCVYLDWCHDLEFHIAYLSFILVCSS